MPLYHFKHKETGEISSEIMKMSELDQFLEDNPDLQQCLNAPKLVDPVTVGRIRHDDSFNDLLKEAKKVHKHSTINAR